jgi:hypothetical protein
MRLDCLAQMLQCTSVSFEKEDTRHPPRTRTPSSILPGHLTALPAVVLAVGVLLSSCKNAPSDSSDDKPDTTSHNILWNVDTLGTYGSGLLDISAVSSRSVYAVGVVWDASGTT